MRSIFARFARPSRRRGVRRREVFSAHFDGGQSAAAVSTSIHLGCDVLERRIVLTASPAEDFVFSQGTITGYQGDGGDVEIPSSINGARVTVIGDNAFRNNATITSVVIPSSVTSINYQAFLDARLTSVTIANAKTSIGDFAFSGNRDLATVSLGKRVTSIGAHAFGLTALTTVTIPRTVTSINDGAFSSTYDALTSVTIANAKTSIGNYAFSENYRLATVSLGNGVTSIGERAFKETALTAVTIPRTVTGIGYQAFYEIGLTSVTIANAKTWIGGEAFYGNSDLATVSLGNGVTSIGISAFADAKALTAVTIPRTVTSIGIYAFNGCNALKTVRFLGNAPSVGTNAFAGVAAGAKAIRAAALTGYGDYGTIWNNLIVAPSGRVAAPTVTVSTASLPQNAATMTIKGKGFVAGVPSANTVTFDNGAVGTVTAATTRTLTVSITTPPSQSGPLMATVTTNIGGSSGALKQVATVIPAP